MVKKLILNKQYQIELFPHPPFNFEGTVFKPSHFPGSDTLFKGKIYWQSLRFRNRYLGIKMVNKGTVEVPYVDLFIFSVSELSDDIIQEIKREIEFRFDMLSNLSEFYEEFKNDEILGPVTNQWRGMRVSSHISLYEYTVITTVLQNATVKRSVQMQESLFHRYGAKLVFDSVELSSYWSPQSIIRAPEKELRALKLGYRAKILKKQAKSFEKGTFNEDVLRNLPTPELKKKLLSIYGIGPASVQYILFEVFKRYDVLEYIPPWEQKIYSRLLFNKELESAEVILKFVKKRWGKWHMLALHYLFENLFWRRREGKISWLENLIRL